MIKLMLKYSRSNTNEIFCHFLPYCCIVSDFHTLRSFNVIPLSRYTKASLVHPYSFLTIANNGRVNIDIKFFYRQMHDSRTVLIELEVSRNKKKTFAHTDLRGRETHHWHLLKALSKYSFQALNIF